MPQLSLLLVFVAACIASAAPADLAPAEALGHRVVVLADDAMEGRGNGTQAALAAADSIRAWLSAAGAEPAPGGWFQDFPLNGQGFEGLDGRNVLAVLPGEGGPAGRWLVVGAHYDHLGLRRDEEGAVTGIYNGAEDNASGVSALVEVVRSLAAAEGPRRSLLVAVFAGEEIGLLGSRHLVEHLPVPLDSLDLMLNLDSVGRLRDDRLYVGGVGSAEGLRPLVQETNARHGFALELSEGGWDASDHVAFNTVGVPVLFLFTGPHPQYHSVDDTADLVDRAGLVRVAGFAVDLLDALAVMPEPLQYRAVSRLDALPAGKAERAWLGTIPDFVEGVEGVRLAGVMPDSPAEECGLAKGDVVVKVGDVEVADLSGLTVALRTHGVGEMVRVDFVRDGERRSLPVTLRPRPR